MFQFKSTILFMLGFISITLFGGGVILLMARIPFWSYYFGIPAVQIGIVFLILTFDRMIRKAH